MRACGFFCFLPSFFCPLGGTLLYSPCILWDSPGVSYLGIYFLLLLIKKKKKNLNKKLPPRYFGPYQVEARVGQVAYKLDLPASTSIHPVFYVYMLQPVVGTVQQAQPFPLLLTEDL